MKLRSSEKGLIPQNPDLRFKGIIKINPTQKQQEQGKQPNQKTLQTKIKTQQ